jgi:hypothetical protein
MVANPLPTPELEIVTKEKANESENRSNEISAPVTLKQRAAKLLREMFEGHEEYLGVTPD